MRVAALYDIHGNLPALEAVLRDVHEARVDLVVSGGDVIPGPMPREVLASLLNLDVPVVFIRGNGDREVVALRAGSTTGRFPETFRAAMQWTADQLDDETARVIAGWSAVTNLHLSALGDVLFCHATPRNDSEIFLRTTAEGRLRPIFEATRAKIVVCGHTHIQFDRTIGTTRVVNAGSVGMPFQAPGAYWLLLGADVELRHTPYDFAQAAERIRATGYPQAEEFADRNVLHPPTEEETIALFSSHELQ
jgi:predicted phosphodiesterase